MLSSNRSTHRGALSRADALPHSDPSQLDLACVRDAYQYPDQRPRAVENVKVAVAGGSAIDDRGTEQRAVARA